MAITDWTRYSDMDGLTPFPAFGTYNWGPEAIDGDTLVAASEMGTHSANAVPSTLPNGFFTGRIRTKLKFKFFSPDAPSFSGVCAQMSQEDMLSGNGGQAYAVGLNHYATFYEVSLFRFTNGIGLDPAVVGPPPAIKLATTIDGIWSPDTEIAIELEWHLRLFSLNGIHLIGRYGPDYDNLIEFASLIERGPCTLTSTVGEGVCFMKTTNNSYVCAADDTELFQMPVIT